MRVTSLAPRRHAGARLNLGVVYQAQGEMEKALATFLEAERRAPHDPLVTYPLWLADELQLGEREPTSARPMRRTFSGELVRAGLQAGRGRDVVPLAERLMRLRPDDAELIYLFGVALFIAEDRAGARAAHEDAPVSRGPSVSACWPA